MCVNFEKVKVKTGKKRMKDNNLHNVVLYHDNAKPHRAFVTHELFIIN